MSLEPDVFGIGITLAHFHSTGNTLVLIHRLYKNVKDSTIYGSESFIIKVLILSTPTDFLFFRSDIYFPTSERERERERERESQNIP